MNSLNTIPVPTVPTSTPRNALLTFIVLVRVWLGSVVVGLVWFGGDDSRSVLRLVFYLVLRLFLERRR